jgi:hypothetical protein
LPEHISGSVAGETLKSPAIVLSGSPTPTTPLPDLTIVAPPQPIEPIVVPSGKLPLIVEKNVGSVDAGMHTDRVYVAIEGVRVLVAGRRHFLRAGESSQLSLPSIPSLPPGKYRARITVVLDVFNEVKELNEENNVWGCEVTIEVPLLTVVSPNGGEVWPVGSTQTIRWRSVGVSGSVRIDISRDGGSTWETIIPNTSNDGDESWIVKGPPTTHARIRVVSLENPSLWDISDRDFTIRDNTPPSISVTSPNGGEVWRVGETCRITWTATDNVGVSRIDVFYSTDGGRTWRTIAARLSNTGSYDWRIPNTPSTNCLVRIDAYDTSENRGSDISDKPFTIRP